MAKNEVNDWEEVPLKSQDSGEDDWEEVEDISQAESGARGFVDSASMGFADEITGGVEAALDWIKNDPNSFKENYLKHRNESRANFQAAKAANPNTYTAGQVGGGITTALIPGLGGVKAASLIGQGALNSLGSSEADLVNGGTQDYIDAARDTAVGGVIGGVTGAVGKVLPVAAKRVGQSLKETGEALALNATGATGRQLENFADDAGRQLLDRKLVRFGDNAGNIAERVGGAKDRAAAQIDEALSKLDTSGATSDLANVRVNLEDKISAMKGNPALADNRRTLQRLSDDVLESYSDEAGERFIPLSKMEEIKRGYRKQAGNWMDLDKSQAGKEAYLAAMKESERAAMEHSPELANLFKQGKETYGLFAPIQEAAERRAAQQTQAQVGNLKDIAAAGFSAATGGPAQALTGLATSRFINPRLASSGAILADNLGDLVKASPELFGPFAKQLSQAAQRGGNALAAENYVMQQRNPEYRALMRRLNGQEDDNE